MKGAPDAILNLVSSVNTEQFKETVAQLGQDGYRIIAMGIQDVAQNSTLFELVYPYDVRNNTSRTRRRTYCSWNFLLLLGSSFSVTMLICLLVWDSFTEQWAH